MLQKTLRFAWSISKEVRVVHVTCEEEDVHLRQRWNELVEAPARAAQLPVPEFVAVQSPYRFVVAPIVDYALRMQSEHPERHLVVLVPELIENHWYNFLLHNNRPQLLKGLLNAKANPRITVIGVPWYMSPAGENS